MKASKTPPENEYGNKSKTHKANQQEEEQPQKNKELERRNDQFNKNKESEDQITFLKESEGFLKEQLQELLPEIPRDIRGTAEVKQLRT